MTRHSLSGISTSQLNDLAVLLANRTELSFPSRADLLAGGLAAFADEALAALGHLDGSMVRVVLDAVLDERAQRASTLLELVWTGPEPRVATSRDTAVVLRELFAAAQTHALVAGFRFSQGDDILAPLHASMRDRGVTAEIVIDGERAPLGVTPDRHVRVLAQRFIEINWPFGDPTPALFYDPRTVTPNALASMHAKCVVVDRCRTFITSANFTDRAQSRNIELGVVIEDASFAREVVAHWHSLISAKLLLPAL